MTDDPPAVEDLSQVFLPPLESLGPSPGNPLKENDSNLFLISSHPGLEKELVFDDLCSFQNIYTVPDSQESGKRKRSPSPSPLGASSNPEATLELGPELEVVEILPPPITLTFGDLSQESLQNQADFQDEKKSNLTVSSISQFKRMKLQMLSVPEAISQEILAETQLISCFGAGLSQAIDSQDEDLKKLKADAALKVSTDFSAPAVDDLLGSDEIVEVEGTPSKLDGIVEGVKDQQLLGDQNVFQNAMSVKRLDENIPAYAQLASMSQSQLLPSDEETFDPLTKPDSIVRFEQMVTTLSAAQRDPAKQILEKQLSPNSICISHDEKLDGINLDLRESDNFNSAPGKENFVESCIPLNNLTAGDREDNHSSSKLLEESLRVRVKDTDLEKNKSVQANLVVTRMASDSNNDSQGLLQQTALSVDVFLDDTNFSPGRIEKRVITDASTLFREEVLSLDLNAEDAVEDSQKFLVYNPASEALPVIVPDLVVQNSCSATKLADPLSSPHSIRDISTKSKALADASIVSPCRNGQDTATVDKNYLGYIEVIGNNVDAPASSCKYPLEDLSSPVKLKAEKSNPKCTRKYFALEGISSSPRRTRGKRLASYAEPSSSPEPDNYNDDDYEMTQRGLESSPVNVKLDVVPKSKKQTTPRSILKSSRKNQNTTYGILSTVPDSSPCMDRTTIVTFKPTRKAQPKIFRNFKFVVTANNKDANAALPRKDKLVKTIESLDGTIFANFSSLFDKRTRKLEKDGECSTVVILIAYVPVRTYKYLMALALGIPIVSASWVVDCKRDGKLHPFNRYLLHNGRTKAGMDISPRASLNGIFNVPLSKESEALINDWKDILVSCGASVVFKRRDHVDYVLCIGSKVLENFENGIFVAHDWVIECLIHQTLLDPSSDASFTGIK